MSPFGPLLCLLVSVFYESVFGQSQIDWCEVKKQHCGFNSHIACMPNGFPTQTTNCQNVKLLPMNSTMKNLILDMHNSFRQQIASGGNSKFPQAKKLAVIEWDDTLQFLAEKQVSYCSFEHDQCRATPNYPNSGQNLYYKSTALQYPNASKALVDGMTSWFDEWKDARSGLVDKLLWDDRPVFHFTVMVHEKNNRVGCGMIQYQSTWGSWIMDSFMLTCNYQYTNALSEPVYTRGSPCSECTCSAQYPALCAGSGGAGTTTTPRTTTTTRATTTTTTTPRTTTTTSRPCFVR